jgi:oxygen-dependent protoporphyrinogen oxidase
LQPVPSNPREAVASRLLSWRGKARLLAEPMAARSREPDESVAAFAHRRLGDEAAEHLVAPMVAGIYAGDPAALSLAAAFPRLAQLEREHGSLLAGLLRAGGSTDRGELASFAAGMSALPTALAARLGASIVRAAATQLEREGARWRVQLATGPAELADAVVVAAPADRASALLADPRARAIGEIPYAPVDVVCLGFERAQVEHDLAGFGFLVTPGETLGILGCLWESSLFPGRAPEGHVLLRIMLGGELPDGEVVPRALAAVRRALGVQGEPGLAHLFRHRRAIPQYTIGHLARVAAADALERDLPGLFWTGNALRGVGVNDCTREAERTAARAAAFLSR